MFYTKESLIDVCFQGKEFIAVSAKEIAEHINDFTALTVYPKLVLKKGFRVIEPTFSMVPFRSVDIFYDSVQVVALKYADNYRDEIKTVYLDPNNKVYTTNKGYISAGNLGGMDVLLNNEGRICRIISKEKESITGDFFNMELVYGNNIMVNGLTVIPQ